MRSHLACFLLVRGWSVSNSTFVFLQLVGDSAQHVEDPVCQKARVADPLVSNETWCKRIFEVTLMGLIQKFFFKTLGDHRGSLVAIESEQNVPFGLRRVFYIFATQEGVVRGLHAHRRLRQVAVCLSGSCRFILDDGKKREEVVLDKPSEGLLIDRMVWNEMHDFTPGCVLLVLADDHYDESEYIRDYGCFLKAVENAA